jgi:hypothetical protein
MSGRLEGKRAIVTDPTESNGADIVSLFREEGALCGVLGPDKARNG